MLVLIVEVGVVDVVETVVTRAFGFVGGGGSGLFDFLGSSDDLIDDHTFRSELFLELRPLLEGFDGDAIGERLEGHRSAFVPLLESGFGDLEFVPEVVVPMVVALQESGDGFATEDLVV